MGLPPSAGHADGRALVHGLCATAATMAASREQLTAATVAVVGVAASVIAGYLLAAYASRRVSYAGRFFGRWFRAPLLHRRRRRGPKAAVAESDVPPNGNPRRLQHRQHAPLRWLVERLVPRSRPRDARPRCTFDHHSS